MSRLECGYVKEKFKPFARTASSESVRVCFERLRTNFLESGVGAEDAFFFLFSPDHRARKIYVYGSLFVY
jgi:hypothetical protein